MLPIISSASIAQIMRVTSSFFDALFDMVESFHQLSVSIFSCLDAMSVSGRSVPGDGSLSLR